MTSVWSVMACALALCLAAMVLLSQAMHRHCEHILPRGEPGPVRIAVLRALSLACMSLALWQCTRWWGPAVGTVLWLGWLSVAALLVAGLLTYAPRTGAACVAVASLSALVWMLVQGLAA
ncbi:MAG: DUF3325 domain-containing protein [Comamonas sp.]|jgi:hypothetical protein|nr:DUF3325 domain-containing protein [Comamonas sp.]